MHSIEELLRTQNHDEMFFQRCFEHDIVPGMHARFLFGPDTEDGDIPVEYTSNSDGPSIESLGTSRQLSTRDQPISMNPPNINRIHSLSWADTHLIHNNPGARPGTGIPSTQDLVPEGFAPTESLPWSVEEDIRMLHQIDDHRRRVYTDDDVLDAIMRIDDDVQLYFTEPNNERVITQTVEDKTED